MLHRRPQGRPGGGYRLCARNWPGSTGQALRKLSRQADIHDFVVLFCLVWSFIILPVWFRRNLQGSSWYLNSTNIPAALPQSKGCLDQEVLAQVLHILSMVLEPPALQSGTQRLRTQCAERPGKARLLFTWPFHRPAGRARLLQPHCNLTSAGCWCCCWLKATPLPTTVRSSISSLTALGACQKGHRASAQSGMLLRNSAMDSWAVHSGSRCSATAGHRRGGCARPSCCRACGRLLALPTELEPGQGGAAG